MARPKKPKTQDAHFYLEPEILDAIREAAKRNDRTMQGEVRSTLRRIYVEGCQIIPQAAAE